MLVIELEGMSAMAMRRVVLCVVCFLAGALGARLYRGRKK